MQNRLALPSLLAATFLTLSAGSCRTTDADAPAATTEQDRRMAWWRDARFGMFLHWGLYAIPAGAWDGNTDHGEWIRTTARIPLDTYAELQPRWDPVAFDADAWARMAKQAGMKYVVITSKHHDGFCLWDSDETDWDVGNTPHGRDILRELSDACREHGLKFCTYHSIMDWHHPDYLPRRGWETDRPTDDADFDRFERYLHAQVTELIERYRPAVMWFDGEWEPTWTHERALRLFELCRSLAPEMIVNNRVDVHRQGMQGFSAADEAVGDFDTPEQEIPATGLPGVDWESCMTMNRHWGWNEADGQWKSTEALLRNLIDIASKGGNYLLNVGPRADGSFPEPAVERLREIGRWMDVNGASIRGTTASVFDELPWGRVTVDEGPDTTRLYLHVFGGPGSRTITLPGLANPVRSATLLADPTRRLPHRGGMAFGGVKVLLPDTLPDPISTVVVVEIEGRPTVFRAPHIEAQQPQFVDDTTFTIENRSAVGAVRYTLDGSEPIWTSPEAKGAIRIEGSTTVSASLFVDGVRRSAIVQKAFTKVDPVPPVEALPSQDGLELRRIDAQWREIPAELGAFDEAPAESINSPTLPAAIGEHTALRYRGFVTVPATGLWRFRLTSDDGSRLLVAGQQVVDHDGLHGATAKVGALALAEGLHQFELYWFNATGDQALTVEWARGDDEFTRIPAEHFRR